jgi:hypothetical protein
MSTIKSLILTVLITVLAIISWFLVPVIIAVGTVAIIAVVVFAVLKDYYDNSR